MLHATSTLELLYRLRIFHRASLSSKKASPKVYFYHYSMKLLNLISIKFDVLTAFNKMKKNTLHHTKYGA